MKKLGIGSWAYTFGPYAKNPVDFKTVVEKVAEIGYDTISIGGFRPHIFVDDYEAPAKRDEFLSLLKKHKLEAAEFSPDPAGLNPVLAADTDRYIARMKRNVDFLSACGITMLRLDTACPPVLPAGVTYQQAWDRTLRVFREITSCAAEKGIKIVWEFEPGFIFNKPGEVVKMVHEIGHPGFTVLFDCCHAYMCSVVAARQIGEKETLAGGVIEFARLLKGKIGMVHLIDSDGTLHDNDTSTHVPFGQGLLDMDSIYQELVKSEIYSGDYISIDLCFWPDAWNVTKQCYEYVRNLQQKYKT
jgi:sugar phosphate isomerase/epimerase